MIRVASGVFIGFSALSLLSVSLMAFANPQSVMDLVGVQLPNNDAYSSIRGVYGGVGLTIVISLIYLIKKQAQLALGFLVMLWGFYAISRTITIFTEGQLGAFGSKWLVIEAVFCLIALVLFVVRKNIMASYDFNGR